MKRLLYQFATIMALWLFGGITAYVTGEACLYYLGGFHPNALVVGGAFGVTLMILCKDRILGPDLGPIIPYFNNPSEKDNETRFAER